MKDPRIGLEFRSGEEATAKGAFSRLRPLLRNAGCGSVLRLSLI